MLQGSSFPLLRRSQSEEQTLSMMKSWHYSQNLKSIESTQEFSKKTSTIDNYQSVCILRNSKTSIDSRA